MNPWAEYRQKIRQFNCIQFIVIAWDAAKLSRERRQDVKQKVPESGVLKACLDLLAAEKIWHRRWNSGAVKADKRFFRFGQKGDADILMIPRISTVWLFCDMHCADGPNEIPWPVWIETKSDSGKQSEAQRQFQAEVERKGHKYLIVRKPEDLIEWLQKYGLIERGA